MLAGMYRRSAAMVSASVVSTLAAGRVATVEPQRMHSALVPGASGSTCCVSPQDSHESTDSIRPQRLQSACPVKSDDLSSKDLHEAHCRFSFNAPPLLSHRLPLPPDSVGRRAGEGRVGPSGHA